MAQPCMSHMLQPSSWPIFKFLFAIQRYANGFIALSVPIPNTLGNVSWIAAAVPSILRPVIAASIAATSNNLVTSALDALGTVSWIAAAVQSIPMPVIGASIAATSNKLVTRALVSWCYQNVDVGLAMICLKVTPFFLITASHVFPLWQTPTPEVGE